MGVYSVYIKGVLVTDDDAPENWDPKILNAAIEHVEVIGVVPHIMDLERAPRGASSKIRELEGASKPKTKKRQYRCAACGQLGHSVLTCPNKDTLVDLPRLGDQNNE